MSDVAITRTEQYLNSIAEGGSVDIKPVTRKELFLAKAAGMDVETPDPVTREEMYLSKISSGSGGVPINNQDKTITQNGTYTADEGYTGLGTVSVNVEASGGDEKSQLDALIDGSITEISSDAETVRGYAFYACTQLKTAIFRSASTLGWYGLYQCLEAVTVDFLVLTKIESNAFLNCRSLTALLIRNESMCTLGNSNAFNSCCHILGTVDSTYNPDGLKDGYIYVPAALVDTYKTATNWSTYADQFRALEDYTVDGTITGELDESKI